MLCTPPLLLIVTPGATWMLEDVFPEFFDPGAAFTSVEADPAVDVELPLVPPDVEAPAAVEVPLVDAAPAEVDASELVGESADVPSVSAADIP
ncbi:hypothetical protein [Mycolicibacterium neworleansense]|uniref:hypothetical protein n=1 Tax=Mycolicibacterium neworleansense TaxID=146018 RepID=UPI001C655945|nr:hypothetical protein [Mycolicibacterium neworleansense]